MEKITKLFRIKICGYLIVALMFYLLLFQFPPTNHFIDEIDCRETVDYSHDGTPRSLTIYSEGGQTKRTYCKDLYGEKVCRKCLAKEIAHKKYSDKYLLESIGLLFLLIIFSLVFGIIIDAKISDTMEQQKIEVGFEYFGLILSSTWFISLIILAPFHHRYISLIVGGGIYYLSSFYFLYKIRQKKKNLSHSEESNES